MNHFSGSDILALLPCGCLIIAAEHKFTSFICLVNQKYREKNQPHTTPRTNRLFTLETVKQF